MLKGAGSDAVALPSIETELNAEYSSDEEMDESLVRNVRQTVDQALVELGQTGVDGSTKSATETAADMEASGTVVQDMSTSFVPSHNPKAHSTPSKEHVETTALLNYSDNECDLSVLMRRPLYPLQQEKEEEDGGWSGGDIATTSPAAEKQVPVWMNLHVCELFLFVLVGLCLTVFCWYALQHYKME